MKGRAQSLGEKVLDYGGCAQLWVRFWDDWMAFYNSKDYAAALNNDCDRFMALPMTYMVGYENLVVATPASQLVEAMAWTCKSWIRHFTCCPSEVG